MFLLCHCRWRSLWGLLQPLSECWKLPELVYSRIWQEYINREKEWVNIQSDSVRDIQSRKCAFEYRFTIGLDIVNTYLYWTMIGLPLYSEHFKSYQDFYVTGYSETVVSYQGYRWTLLGIVIVYVRFGSAHAHDIQWTFSWVNFLLCTWAIIIIIIIKNSCRIL